ncbi:hypothetical protein [Palleronia aestuarii]|nr:hypothetical protein [Palleronia aestuarii]
MDEDEDEDEYAAAMEKESPVVALAEGADGVWYVAYREEETITGLTIFKGPIERDGKMIEAIIVSSEKENPSFTGAPREILDLLTPTGNRAANRWREACRSRGQA